MLRQYVLLLCLAHTANAVSRKNEAEIKAFLKSEVEQLREQTAKVQQEMSELGTTADFGVKQEVAYKIPADLDHEDSSEEPVTALTQMSSASTQPATQLSSESEKPEEEIKKLPEKIEEALKEGDIKTAEDYDKEKNAKSSSSSTADEDAKHMTKPEEEAFKKSHPDMRYFRPGVIHGGIDNVEFGIRLKKWYGIQFKDGTFGVDAIITTRWKDDRTKELVPSEAKTVRLSYEDAKKLMWIPDIQVTNIAKKPDVISSSVLVNKNGDLLKVVRLLLLCKQGFATKDFPFDTQTVAIRVASKVYMQDELRLVPSEDEDLIGVSPKLFEKSAWDFKGSELTEFIDEDGELRKSRGQVRMTVKRVSSQFVSSVFIPSAILLVMTWCTLWFPFVAAFVMPRVAISVISVLCMMSLLQMSMSLAPAARTWTWMGQYLELCVELQFLLLISNALFLSLYHRRSSKDPHADDLIKQLANHLDNELIIAYPLFTALLLGCACAGQFKACRFVLCTVLGLYIGYIFVRYQRFKKQAAAAADEEMAEKS